MSEVPVPREVRVEVVPAIGYELEIENALSIPFVLAADIEGHYEDVIADCVRRELFIADDVPLVLIVADEDGEHCRIERPAKPR